MLYKVNAFELALGQAHPSTDQHEDVAHGDGREPDRALSGDDAIRGYVENEEKTAAALQGR